MDIYKKWQEQDTPEKDRTVALIIGGLIFPLTIPLILAVLMPGLDRRLGLGSFYLGWGNIAAGAALAAVGGYTALSTVFAQIRLASGTPFPTHPTKKLLIVGPFRYCRNPMTLGTLMLYGGIAVAVGSFSALAVVALIGALLIAYLKIFEEKELQLRFGDEYAEYKKNTPFMIPRFGKR